MVKYCPHCGHSLTKKTIDDRERLACSNCDYVYWNNPVPVVAAIVEQEGHILLARKRNWPPDLWALIAGFPEVGETMEQAVLREVREETGLEGEVLGLVGVYSLPTRNQVFIVYRVGAKNGPLQVSAELEAVRPFTHGEVPQAQQRLDPQSGAGRALRDWLRQQDISA